MLQVSIMLFKLFIMLKVIQIHHSLLDLLILIVVRMRRFVKTAPFLAYSEVFMAVQLEILP